MDTLLFRFLVFVNIDATLIWLGLSHLQVFVQVEVFSSGICTEKFAIEFQNYFTTNGLILEFSR